MVRDSENLWKVVKTVMNIQVSRNVRNSSMQFQEALCCMELFGWLVS